MIKLIKRIIGLFLILIIALACLVLFWLGPTLKKTLETIGPKATGTPFTIDKLRILPLTGTVQLNGLFVGNTPGFKNASAAELKAFRVRIAMASLLSDTIVIKEILIDAPQITYERNMQTDNIKVLRKNIQAWKDGLSKDRPAVPPTEPGAPGEPPPAGPEKPKTEKPEKKVIIEKLVVKNGVVLAKLPGLPTTRIPLPEIEEKDIGKKRGGISPAHASTEIGNALYHAIIDAVSNINTSDVLKHAEKTATDAVKSLGGLFNKKEE